MDAGWQLTRTAPASIPGPAELLSATLEWRDAKVPGTVASTLLPSPETPTGHDADDWWYVTRVPAPALGKGARAILCLEGLATLAQVWFNGSLVVESRNMFIGHRVDVTGLLSDENQLVIRFASLDAELRLKRPRPRWRTALVNQQNLRWIRTTLLGRIPGWTPPFAPIGPWAPVSLEIVEHVEVSDFSVRGDASGILHVRAKATSHDGPIDGARMKVGEAVYPIALAVGTEARIAGAVRIDNAPLWWPHTHGEPRLMPCSLELRVGNEWIATECAAVGFRDVSLDGDAGRVRFVINGTPVFCRGAVWTPLDIRTLRSAGDELRPALESLRDAGLNMLRVGGTMVYESDEFYRLCDELGILVWQDFMFANMDYPVGDAAFRADIEAEARYHVDRLARHPCVAAWCGGSEVAQQAAMMGRPPEEWTNDFFDSTLPRLCAEAMPGVP